MTLLKPSLFLATVLSGLTLLSACSPAPENKLLAETTRLSIVPGYRDFADASHQLREASEHFCAQTTEQNAAYQTLRTTWQNTATTWAAIQPLQFGPLLVDNQAWKIQFWPDRKNLVARKVEALLKGDEPLDVARIEKASVVAQGLSALEYLLFDEKAGQIDRYKTSDGQRRCELLIATSAHLEGVAVHLHTAWQTDGGNYADTFSQPGKNNRDFPESNVAIGTLLDSIVYGLELVKRDKLERPLGLANNKPQIYLLEWWRSRYSLEAITANLAALQRLYKADSGYGLDDYLTQAKGEKALADKIERKFVEVLKLASEIKGNLFSSADNADTLKKAAALSKAVTELEMLTKNELPAALGVTLSFNSSDGD